MPRSRFGLLFGRGSAFVFWLGMPQHVPDAPKTGDGQDHEEADDAGQILHA
ncbi:hypothetical protein HMPREF9440_00882 [Sutterella parvirubra YIT 11816]|uniref:Uncharacterized protein n=1 Tax=Sutterella parvirubra YIT 11816 TaxID=762967 RepID=H3KDS1_9BURK|nr:hypothetical protein HMPREF9440_00882 [Sutterella parvirubra YIT 11816]